MRSSFKIVLNRKDELSRIALLSRQAGMTPAEWCTKVVKDALKDKPIERVTMDPVPHWNPDTVRVEDSSVTIIEELTAEEVKRRYHGAVNHDAHVVEEVCDNCGGSGFDHKGIGQVPCPQCQSTSGQRSWAEEFDRMDKMTEGKGAYTKKLIAGRQLPYGFRDWGRQERIEWLDANWPL